MAGTPLALVSGMYHFACHAFPGTVLFRDWQEARALWDRIVALPGLRCCCLMPDHCHGIQITVDRSAWAGVMRGYAKWRGRYRGTKGEPVWMPLEPPERLSSWKHVRRSVRYVHLNPCRDRLVDDPLAWSFSTHLDFVGLALPAVVAIDRDPPALHAYVSSDPSVQIEGTSLPFAIGGGRRAGPDQVLAAVSALTRQPVGGLFRRSGARILLIRCLVELTDMTTNRVAKWVGVDPATVWRCREFNDPRVYTVERAVGDHRFSALFDGRLDHEWAWRRYLESRERKGVPALLEKKARQRARRERAWAALERQLER